MRLRNIDRYIQSKLQNFRPNHSAKDDIWSNIEKELDSQKPVASSKAFQRMAAAAVVLIALIPAYRFAVHHHVFSHRQLTEQAAVIVHKQIIPKADKGDHLQSTVVAGVTASSANAVPDNTYPQAVAANKHSNITFGTESNIANAEINAVHSEPVSQAPVQSGPYRNLQEMSGATPENIDLSVENTNAPSVASAPGNAEGNDLHNSSFSDIAIYKASLQAYSNIITRESIIKSEQIALAERPLLYASVNGRRPLIKPLNEKKLQEGKNALSSAPQYWANWQSIYYHFWDNPAFAGMEGRYNFNVDDQVTSTNNSLRPDYTNHFAFDMKIPRFGLGLGVYHEREVGITSLNTHTGMAASLHLLSVGSGELSGGFSADFIQRNNFSKLFLFSKDFDPVFGFITDKYNHFSHTVNTIAYNAGLWYSGSNTIMGLDVHNINNPIYGGAYDAVKIPSQWRATIGYRIEAGNNFQLMPWIEGTRLNDVNVFTGRLMAVYKNAYMLGVGYENIDPQTHLGNLTFTASVQVKKRVRAFASFGKNMGMVQTGIEQHILYSGLRVQLH
jgi:hypothetical protein